MVATLLLACWTKRDAEEPDPAILAVDELHRRRAEAGVLEQERDALLALGLSRPEDVQVGWRLARVYVALARGKEEEHEVEQQLRLARTAAWECLAWDPGFAVRVDLSHGLLGAGALERVTRAYLPCLAQLSISWTRWVEIRGVAGSVDLPELLQMAERWAVLDPDQWLVTWARGMAHAMDSRGERAEEASDELLMAANALPVRAELYLDWIVHGVGPRDEGEYLRQLQSFDESFPPEADGEWAWENSKARARARALLESSRR